MDKGISQCASEGRDEDLAIRGGLEEAGEPAEEDARVGSNAGFEIGLGLGEVAEEVVVENAVVELREWSAWQSLRYAETYFGSDEENRLDGSFPNDRHDVVESGELKRKCQRKIIRERVQNERLTR